MIYQCQLNVMKRYEYKIIAALLTIVFSMSHLPGVMGAPEEGLSKERRWATTRNSHYQCTSISNSNASYFVRSSCPTGGYLTVHRGRVVLQLGSPEPYSELAAFEKESCSMNDLDSSPMVRYRHKQSGRHLCFRNGKIRAVKHNMARAPRKNCLFREGTLEASSFSSLAVNTFHTIQSVARKGWFLGFSPKSLRHSSTFKLKGVEGRGAMPSPGRTRIGPGCGFLFHSEEGKVSRQVEEELMDSILSYVKGGEVSTIVNKAASGHEDVKEEKEGGTRLVNDGSDMEPSDGRNSVSNRFTNRLRTNRKGGRRRDRRRNPVRHLSKKRPRPDRRTKNQRKKLRPKERMSRRRSLSN